MQSILQYNKAVTLHWADCFYSMYLNVLVDYHDQVLLCMLAVFERSHQDNFILNYKLKLNVRILTKYTC